MVLTRPEYNVCPNQAWHETLSSQPKLFIKTHGCQMNEYDSSKMADLLGVTDGYVLTDIEAEADREGDALATPANAW